MKTFRIVFFVILISLLACSRHQSDAEKKLERVEKALEVNVDSALNLFSMIDSAAVRTDKEMMEYDYLRNLISLEQDNYQHFNDSTAAKGYEYAINNGDNHLKAKASYMEGVAHYLKNDMKGALECQFDALNFLEGIDDPYLEGRINKIIAIIYHVTFKPGSGIKHAQRAAECFERIGNRQQALDCQVILLKLQHASNDHDTVVKTAQAIAEEAKSFPDKAIRFEALTTLANTYAHNEQFDKAIEVFRKVDEENLMTPYYEGEYIFTLVLNGDLAQAKDRLAKTDSISQLAQIVKAKEVYYLAIGDTVSAYKQAAILNNWQSDVMAQTFNDGIIDSVEESYRKDRELKAEKIKSANIIKWSVIISSAIILLLITTVGIWYYRNKMRLKNLQLDLQMDEIRQLSDYVDHYRLQVDDYRLQKQQLDDDISALFKKQWGTLNMLCNEYFEKGENPSLKATILTEVEKEIKRISGRDGLKSIEEALNRHFEGIITKLKEQLPEFDKKDIAFLTFSYAGFSPRAICLFTGFTIKYYYKKRAVLKEKILATSAPDRQLFVDLLG